MPLPSLESAEVKDGFTEFGNSKRTQYSREFPRRLLMTTKKPQKYFHEKQEKCN